MSAKFCHNCGKKLLAAANFCGSCGTNLNSLANTKPVIPEPQNKKGQFTPFAIGRDEDDEEGDSYIDKLSHLHVQLNKLEFETIGIANHKPETLRDTLIQGIESKIQPIVENRNPVVTDKAKGIEQFQREAGLKTNISPNPATSTEIKD